MYDKEITLTVTLDEAIRLAMAATAMCGHCIREAQSTEDEYLHTNRTRSANMWKRIHDKLSAQYKAQMNTNTQEAQHHDKL